MKSIRSTTTWLTFIGVSILGIVVCTSAYWIAKQILIKNFDQDLLIELQNVSGVSRVWSDDDFYVDIDFDMATQFNIGGSRLFQVWSAGQDLGDYLEVLDRSPMLEELDIELPYPVMAIQAAPYFYNLNFPNGQPGRAVFKRTTAPWAIDETKPDVEEFDAKIDIVVARERQSLDSSIAILFRWMFIIAAIVPLVSFFIVYFAIGLGMAPLKLLTRKMSDIKTSGEHIPADNIWAEEITPVVNTFNKLLTRLEKGMQRERRFTGDLAHEMRTPLAELRIATDIALRANTKERLVTAVQQVNTLSHSIAELVNGMLLLTRIQSDNHALTLTPVDIAPLFQQQCERIHKRTAQRTIQVIKTAPKVLVVETDLVLLTTIFSNLINNAVEHSPSNSELTLSLEKKGLGFRFSVSNLAPDLESPDLDHLSEPFWCKEQSRNTSNHFGLGLSIVHEAITCLNLELKVDLTKDKRLTFVCQKKA